MYMNLCTNSWPKTLHTSSNTVWCWLIGRSVVKHTIAYSSGLVKPNSLLQKGEMSMPPPLTPFQRTLFLSFFGTMHSFCVQRCVQCCSSRWFIFVITYTPPKSSFFRLLLVTSRRPLNLTLDWNQHPSSRLLLVLCVRRFPVPPGFPMAHISKRFRTVPASIYHAVHLDLACMSAASSIRFDCEG